MTTRCQVLEIKPPGHGDFASAITENINAFLGEVQPSKILSTQFQVIDIGGTSSARLFAFVVIFYQVNLDINSEHSVAKGQDQSSTEPTGHNRNADASVAKRNERLLKPMVGSNPFRDKDPKNLPRRSFFDGWDQKSESQIAALMFDAIVRIAEKMGSATTPFDASAQFSDARLSLFAGPDSTHDRGFHYTGELGDIDLVLSEDGSQYRISGERDVGLRYLATIFQEIAEKFDIEFK